MTNRTLSFLREHGFLMLLLASYAAAAYAWVAMPHLPRTTFLERAWVLLAFTAVCFTAWLCDDNVKNYKSIKEAIRQRRAVKYGPRWWVAVGSLVSGIGMYIVWVCFAAIGIASLYVSPESSIELRERYSMLVSVLLLVATTVLALVQVWQVYTRRKIRVYAH